MNQVPIKLPQPAIVKRSHFCERRSFVLWGKRDVRAIKATPPRMRARQE